MSLSSQMQKMLIQEAKEKRFPIAVNLELLPVCNLNCVMCYIRSDWETVKALGGVKPVEEWLRIARELKKAGTLFLLLTGGEVFLYPQFKELYIGLYQMGFSITINTNATLIQEETIEWLRQYPPKCISISLYGASNETYEALCGRKGMFDRVDRAVHLLAQNGIRFELKTMYTPLNVKDEEACYAYAEQFHVYYEAAGYSFPPFRKLQCTEQIRFSPEETAIFTLKTNLRLAGEQRAQQMVIDHLQKYEDTRNLPGADIYGFTCGAGNSSCWITWQGRMTPCAMLYEPGTYPFETGFLPAWEELKHKCDQILLSKKCSYCEKRMVCTSCPAASCTEAGGFECESPFHCEMTEVTLREMEKLVREWGLEDRIVRKGNKA